MSDPGVLAGDGSTGSTQSPIPSDLSSSLVSSSSHGVASQASSVAGTSQDSATQPAAAAVGIVNSNWGPNVGIAAVTQNNNSGSGEVLSLNNNNGVGNVTSEVEPSSSLTEDVEPPPCLHLATDPTEEVPLQPTLYLYGSYTL